MLVSVFIVFALLTGCAQPPSTLTTDNEEALSDRIFEARSNLSPVALQYLESALDTIETHHAIGTDYNWEEWRLAVLNRSQNAEVPSDTYSALQYGLNLLPGGHARFLEPATEQASSQEQSTSPDNQDIAESDLEQSAEPEEMIQARIVDDRIGFVVVPTFMSSVPIGPEVDAFASELQSRVRELDAENPCGWIVDLRENRGGNMWPMLAGMGPLLGRDEIGFIATREGLAQAWYYVDGEVQLDEMTIATVDNPYKLNNPLSPVAVLIGDLTASSGEGVAIAFQGLGRTKLFGNPTAGDVSSPVVFELDDGAMMMFAGTFMADRTGTVYTGPIEPDVHIELDQAKQAAIQWLDKHEACSRSH